MLTSDITEFLSTSAPHSHRLLRAVSSDGYLVCRRDQAQTRMNIQVAAGRQLENSMAAENQQWLYDQGFRRKRASANFSKKMEVDAWSPEEMEQWIGRVFERCFGGNTYAVSQLKMPVVELANQPVIEAMRYLAKQRDWAARKTLYRLLIDASFIVPIDDTDDIQAVDKMGSFPVCAAFTAQELFLKANPLGAAFAVKTGRQLFPTLVSKRFGSMRINPHTEVRGELYLNELQMLVEGILRLDAHYGSA